MKPRAHLLTFDFMFLWGLSKNYRKETTQHCLKLYVTPDDMSRCWTAITPYFFGAGAISHVKVIKIANFVPAWNWNWVYLSLVQALLFVMTCYDYYLHDEAFWYCKFRLITFNYGSPEWDTMSVAIILKIIKWFDPS